jgi:hypothetical protein
MNQVFSLLENRIESIQGTDSNNTDANEIVNQFSDELIEKIDEGFDQSISKEQLLESLDY